VIEQLRAELLKLRTTRTTAALVLAMVALVLLFTLLGGLLTPRDSIGNESDQRSILSIGHIATLFTALVGIMLVTSEFRFGTIRPTLLYAPRRPLLIAAKAVAGLLAGLAIGIVAEALAVVVGLVVLSGRGVDRVVSYGDILRFAVGGAAVTALWAVIGVGVGAIVRHQVGAIVGLLAYAFIVENLVFGLAPSVGRYLPGPAGQALAGDTTDRLLGVAAGGGLLLAYAVVLAAAGAAVTALRDVD
jgi:ABC-2 type transport system permease protein